MTRGTIPMPHLTAVSDSSAGPCAPPTRRGFLQRGASAALSLFWADWLRAAAGPARGPGKARSVILIFNSGAPCHIDLWDPKPDAPEGVRGPYRPIATGVPGV